MGTSVPAGLEIRHAALDDANAISELLTELGHPLAPALARTQIDRIQALAPNHAVFAAVVNGSVVGLVSAFSTPVLHRALPVERVSVLVVTRSHAASHREAAHRFYRERGYAQQRVKFTRDIPEMATP